MVRDAAADVLSDVQSVGPGEEREEEGKEKERKRRKRGMSGCVSNRSSLQRVQRLLFLETLLAAASGLLEPACSLWEPAAGFEVTVTLITAVTCYTMSFLIFILFFSFCLNDHASHCSIVCSSALF